MITKRPTGPVPSERVPQPRRPVRATHPQNPPTWLVQIQEALRKGVETLLEQSSDMIFSAPEWDELGELLESFPLPTAQFALAMNRLNNAKDYVAAGEFGAAKFELKLMLGGLTQRRF